MKIQRYWKAIAGAFGAGVATLATVLMNAPPEGIDAQATSITTALVALGGALGPLIFPKNAD